MEYIFRFALEIINHLNEKNNGHSTDTYTLHQSNWQFVWDSMDVIVEMIHCSIGIRIVKEAIRLHATSPLLRTLIRIPIWRWKEILCETNPTTEHMYVR